MNIKNIKHLKILIFIIFLSHININAYALTVETISIEDLNKMTTEESKYKLFYFFATWCSECRKSLRDLIEKGSELIKDGLKIYYISLDYDKNFLKKYLIRFQQKEGNVYYVENAQYKINLFFKQHNIDFDQSIPYIIIYDPNDNVIASGGYHVGKVLEFLKKKLSE